MYPTISYLAESYFHPDYQDEADEPIDVVEKFRDQESAEVVEALRSEVAGLLDSDATEDDLSRMWVDEADAYYDPADDEITMRDWLLVIADVLDRKGAGAGSPDPDGGIPFKGTTPS